MGDDTKMNANNIRLHIRVLRRLSMAVRDPSAPVHKDSALWWIEKNEYVFGRRSHETSIQETPKYLGAFCTALPQSDRLRDACENLHIANLRGHSIRGGRHVGDWARALAMVNQIPAAILDRFPKYKDFLENFESMRPVKRSLPNGDVVTTTPELAVYGQPSLEQMVQLILLPLYDGKQYQGFLGSKSAVPLEVSMRSPTSTFCTEETKLKIRVALVMLAVMVLAAMTTLRVLMVLPLARGWPRKMSIADRNSMRRNCTLNSTRWRMNWSRRMF